jgi:hypothetical protein
MKMSAKQAGALYMQNIALEEKIAELEKVISNDYEVASSYALSIYKHYYKNKPDAVAFELCDTSAGVVTQIDNMVTGVVAGLESSCNAKDLEKMALAIKASIDFWHRNTSNKMQGHIEHGILGKRPIDNPDAIPVDILERDMNALIEQAKQLRAEVK